MKKTTQFTIAVTAAFFLFTSCQREAHNDLRTSGSENNAAIVSEQPDNSLSYGKGSSGPCNPNAYTVLLESRTAVAGGWEWIWSIQNPNPGNGNNGTAQDLSNWGMQFGPCFTTASMISAGYSPDGSSWTTFNPTYEVNPSQNCITTPVLKFDFGTVGSAKSYYRLVVSENYSEGLSGGYYKSGGNTGCCSMTFTGISCGDDEGPR